MKRYPIGTLLAVDTPVSVITGIVVGYEKKLYLVKWIDNGEIMRYDVLDLAPFVVG